MSRTVRIIRETAEMTARHIIMVILAVHTEMVHMKMNFMGMSHMMKILSERIRMKGKKEAGRL